MLQALSRTALAVSLFERLLDVYNPNNPANPISKVAANSDWRSPMAMQAVSLGIQYVKTLYPLQRNNT